MFSKFYGRLVGVGGLIKCCCLELVDLSKPLMLVLLRLTKLLEWLFKFLFVGFENIELSSRLSIESSVCFDGTCIVLD